MIRVTTVQEAQEALRDGHNNVMCVKGEGDEEEMRVCQSKEQINEFYGY